MLNKTRGFQDSLSNFGHSSKHKILNVSIIKADSEISQKLNIDPDTTVFFLERLIWEDAAPMAIDKIYLPEKNFSEFYERYC